ncbi:MAG: c-type cytochrome [Planctomycetia bacterium]|nr:c-type cytochrome [Planctomycetia bacterium]
MFDRLCRRDVVGTRRSRLLSLLLCVVFTASLRADDDEDLDIAPKNAARPPARLDHGKVAPAEKAAPAEEAGLIAPEGFTATRYADDSLAHDIFSMTIDAQGRVVVSGPGYVRILEDRDGDGRADHAIDFTEGPASGAQGMYFYGKNLLCTADEGLIHYKDEDGDDRADGPPDVLLRIKTGGEHHAHALRRGPDGWWYLIAGNFAEVTKGYVTEAASPVKTPHGGVILRLKPDASGAEIIADCFRNPYDFDFDAHGELFTYDSDGEQDISLPWYMPTRLFHVVPGGEHGWISENCKRPDYVLDAAPVVASTGRGSPAGVVCYRHTQFPKTYRDGLFILDWTFGRVMHVPLVRKGATYAPQQPVDFVTAQGQMGFAPTDIEVGIDGSLYVCVGGRGTHGTVYRIKYTGKERKEPAPLLLTIDDNAGADQKMTACLEAPQPTSSWSRARWVPIATKLGAQAFLSVALDEHQSTAARIRAIEILTDLFAGLPGTAAEILAMVKSPELRARAVWSLGARPPQGLSSAVLARYLGDSDAAVRRRALETAARFRGNSATLLPGIAKCANDEDRLVRMAVARVMPGLKPDQFKQLGEMARKLSWRAALTTTLGYVWRTQATDQPYNAYAVDIGRRILEGKHSIELKLEAVRVLQLAFGDVGDEDAGPVFESYSPGIDLESHERDLDPLRIVLAKVFPTGNANLDLELGRLIAMLSPANDELLSKVISKITADSSPVDDIHYLIVAARMPATPGAQDREKLATALLTLEQKLVAQGLRKDANWNARVSTLYSELIVHAPALPEAVISDPTFGRPGHVALMAKLSQEQLAKAVAAFVKAVKNDDHYPWNNDVVFVIGSGKTPEHYDLIRTQFEKFDLRMAALMVLAQQPDEQDRERYAAGLDSEPIEILTTCISALEKLPEAKNAVELTALVKTLRRLGDQKVEFALRERIVKLLERNSGEEIGFVFGPAGYKPQPEAIQKWTEWVTTEFPEESERQLGGGSADLPSLKERIADVNWEDGDLERGHKLYVSRGCAQCHGAGSGLGPDLAGATSRFSREDLFIAIALPNRDVSPRYQTTLVETKSGQIYTGMPVFDSADIRVLRNSVNQTFTIRVRDIESERKLAKSLMPEGLVKDLKDEDLADLYAYLKSLSIRTAGREPAAEPEKGAPKSMDDAEDDADSDAEPE